MILEDDTGPNEDLLESLALARMFLAQQAELGVRSLPKGSVGDGALEGLPVDKLEQLEAFHASIQACQACKLAQGRRVVVFGSGNPDADVLFVGEAPGAEEDRQGVPFVGAAGQLLTRMILSIGLSREQVYIANIIKCRPPGNRDPEPDEIAQCEPYLIRQLEVIQPAIICTLGRFAAQTLLKTSESMGRLRGRVFTYQEIKLIPTYHPAALLHNPQWKRPTWEDLKLLRKEYDGTEL